MLIDNVGNIGVGTTNPTSRVEIIGQDGLAITGFQPYLTLRDSNSSDSRSIIQGANGDLDFFTNNSIGGTPLMILRNSTSNVGIGTPTPHHKLRIVGGPVWTSSGWTGSLELDNVSALGWGANAGGSRFGIGQSGGGLYIFHTASDPGTSGSPAVYDLTISDSGNVSIGDTPHEGEKLYVKGTGAPGDLTAVFENGSVYIGGTLTKNGGSFRIDHPLDPANKYLQHSFVESPDMMNVYNGNVITDATGYADILLPEWFGALNRDFRYQLTVLDTTDSDRFVQAKVVKKIESIGSPYGQARQTSRFPGW